MQIWLILLSIFSVTTARIVILFDHHKTKKTLNEIEAMLDEAIKGDFLESTWDESMLSAVEGKLARYLKITASYARNLREQKAKMKLCWQTFLIIQKHRLPIFFYMPSF